MKKETKGMSKKQMKHEVKEVAHVGTANEHLDKAKESLKSMMDMHKNLGVHIKNAHKASKKMK